MKRKSLLMVSFAVLCGSSVFSQDLSTSKTVQEKPIQKEEKSVTKAQPLSTKKESNLNSAKGEATVLDRKTVKNQPAKTDL